jgi:hypothetical protein
VGVWGGAWPALAGAHGGDLFVQAAELTVARYGGDVHHSAGEDSAVLRTVRLPTITTVGCYPPSVKIGVKSSCTALAIGLGSEPVTITFKTTGGVLSGARCRTFDREEDCTAEFGAAKPGRYTVTAAYPGDGTHAPSSGHNKVTVTSP